MPIPSFVVLIVSESFRVSQRYYGQTDGQTDGLYFIWSETSSSLRCKLLIEIIIPSARV